MFLWYYFWIRGGVGERKVCECSQLCSVVAYDWCVYCALLSRSFYVED